MNEAKKILEPIVVGVGTATTWLLAFFSRGFISGLKDLVTISVGMATLIYTIYKIMEIRAKRRARLDEEANEAG